MKQKDLLMKKIGLFLFMIFSMMHLLQAQSYSQLWSKVEEMVKKDLPLSVVREAKTIFELAQVDKNVPQMMKAYLTMMTYRGEISPDSMEADKKWLEDWATDEGTSKSDRAVLYSILGGMTIHDDFNKGNKYLLLSLVDGLELAQYPAGKLVPLVKSGETSRLYMEDNLYDLLARRAIEWWRENQWNNERENTLKSIGDTYQTLLDFYQKSANRGAWLLTALEAYPEAKEEQLRAWIEEYGDLDVCAEVYLRLSQIMSGEERMKERMELVRQAIKRYPHYDRINVLKNVEKEILSPRLNMTIFSAYPDMPVQVKVNYRNLKGLVVEIYRLNLSPEADELKTLDEKKAKQYGTCIREEYIPLHPSDEYKWVETSLEIDALSQGVYYLSFEGKNYPKTKDGVVVVVSPTMEIYRPLPGNMRETRIVDKISGLPIGESMITPEVERWQRYRYEENNKEQIYANLFTDRAIYRPGQSVYFSGLVYEQYRDSLHVAEGVSLQVTLWDANGTEMDKQKVETDAWGSFNGVFVLPVSGQTGIYRIKVGAFVQTFRVEEYKRPEFEVAFGEIKSTYLPGDTLEVDGTAVTFAGAPIQNARVKYIVNRIENSWWRRKGPITHTTEGETVTDINGRFVIPVHFLPVKEENTSLGYHAYEVLAEVISQTGKTHSESLYLPLGPTSVLFSVQPRKEKLVKEQQEPITFEVCNLKGQPIETNVFCEIYCEDKIVRKFVVESNKAVVLDDLYQLPSGQYRLKARVEDENGKENRQEFPFTLFSLDDTRVPNEASEWGYQTSHTFPSTILYGSSEKEVTLFYDVFSGNKHLESKRVAFSDSLLRFPFEYKEEYGDGIWVSLAFIKDSQLYAQTYTIRKPAPQKMLNLKWTSFRDRLQPGERETWILNVAKSDGTPVEAQLLATMYDVSLNAFVPHAWNMNVAFKRSVPATYWRMKENANSGLNLFYPIDYLDVSPLEFSVLDVPTVSPRWGNGMVMSRRMMTKAGAMNDTMNEVAETESVSLIEQEDLFSVPPVKYDWFRSNFAETAFFYPNLRSNEKGEIKIEFTLPESLTTWKFMGLAHTKDMDYGSISSEVVVSKEFMLQPNLPRFVRTGDEVSLSASLINLSDKDVMGDVRMELFNPKDEKVYLVKKQRFLVTPKATAEVHFGFVVKEEYSDFAVRWIAEGDRFSDGEQCVLPVLSNKQRITESIPFYQNGKGTSVLSLESLFNHHSKTITHPSMTVEYAGNPGWYAVQALSSMHYPDNENAISWMVTYYAHAITAYLMETNPIMAQRYDQESLEEHIVKSLRQLQDLQNDDGSWSWYKGMSGNRYVSTQIVEWMARLKKLTGSLVKEAEKMYADAMAYLKTEVEKEYNGLKKREQEGNGVLVPSEQVIRYLYICAIDNNLDRKNAMVSYLMRLLMKHENRSALTIYEKAYYSIILHAVGEKRKAKDLLQSIREYAVYSDEMGLYFDTPRARYSWSSYKIPTQVAVIEAVNCIDNDEKTVEELKRWLLQQKRVQDWETPIATTDAVYALLNIGKNVLDDSGDATLTVGKQVIRVIPNDTLSYVHQAIDGDVLNIKEVKVKKHTKGMGWGAIYAEYEEDMDQIESQGNALYVDKEIYKNGKPLLEDEVLKLGDKLTIRLKMKVDRDMDFIELKDERAACLEPVDVLSGYHWTEGLGYYQRTKDSFTSFYMDHVRKGTYSIEYDVYVNLAGCYQSGAAVVQSVYAPEFNGYDGGGKVRVE